MFTVMSGRPSCCCNIYWLIRAYDPVSVCAVMYFTSECTKDSISLTNDGLYTALHLFLREITMS